MTVPLSSIMSPFISFSSLPLAQSREEVLYLDFAQHQYSNGLQGDYVCGLNLGQIIQVSYVFANMYHFRELE